MLEEACEAAELAQLTVTRSFFRSHLGSLDVLGIPSRWNHSNGQMSETAPTGRLGILVRRFRRTSPGHWNCFVSSGVTRHREAEDYRQETKEDLTYYHYAIRPKGAISISGFALSLPLYLGPTSTMRYHAGRFIATDPLDIQLCVIITVLP